MNSGRIEAREVTVAPESPPVGQQRVRQQGLERLAPAELPLTYSSSSSDSSAPRILARTSPR